MLERSHRVISILAQGAYTPKKKKTIGRVLDFRFSYAHIHISSQQGRYDKHHTVIRVERHGNSPYIDDAEFHLLLVHSSAFDAAVL